MQGLGGKVVVEDSKFCYVTPEDEEDPTNNQAQWWVESAAGDEGEVETHLIDVQFQDIDISENPYDPPPRYADDPIIIRVDHHSEVFSGYYV